eukprot:6184623-Prymnesium_polylepis.1
MIPDGQGKDYTESLHDREQIDINLVEFILSIITAINMVEFITDESERKDMEDACNNDARTLILNIH